MRDMWSFVIPLLILVAVQVTPVDGQWDTWTSWSSCSVTCDSGIQNRSRSCTGGGGNCTGDSEETLVCTLASCTLCPATSFTCHAGNVLCVSSSVRCDCTSDCSDGSDETTGYAGCTSQALAACETGSYEKQCDNCYTAGVALIEQSQGTED
ncbi:hypothetical protein FSP39_024803 [Pinctada imbricata]|uniref:Uncharacterized protein n=1 Tax=Pinctada imbricata TaxID=66713 RepID=A0AA88YBW9_PINIB|nr:hypothetical protein FSP39_024803 [Pinctada imbricata]